MVKIVNNKLLGGWFVVTGPHHFPLGGPFPSKAAAKQSLVDAQAKRDAKSKPVKFVTGDGRRFTEKEYALAYADRVHQQTGIIISVQEVK